MIPKTIHYCWFGRSPLPPLAEKCIASWRKFLPDYEIKEWNEDNFDVYATPYTAKAYEAKKYAFVSDYARFWILYKYGGVYFDTDVEVIKPMDDILALGSYMGFERDPRKGVNGKVNPGLGFAVERGNDVVKKILDYYSELNFEMNSEKTNDIETIVEHTTKILTECGLTSKPGIQKISKIYVYPSDYFAPIHIVTHRLHITRHTHTIHQYMASWVDNKQSFIGKLRNLMPEKILIMINRLKHPELY